ncbi:MAG: serine hydrolase [Parachlamydiaceae bacterium]|nr:serine hydrolase [Parachlamydiaceae bacterium]
MTGVRHLVFIFIFAFLGNAWSSEITEITKPAQSIEELQTQLESVLTDMHVPGMSVAIVDRNGPGWIAGLGKADLSNDQVVTSATLFRIGSVSKGFASLSILKLADEGKLSLEDPVKKLAPEVWFENKWEESDPVRIVNLLENTTGWDDMHLREFAKNPSIMSSLETLDYDHSSRISRWRPGTRMAYCNSGPAVAAYIVEKISGKKIEDYVGENFFKPIGMQTATYYQPIQELTTKLYYNDGKTPHPYWNLLYRSIGAVNASANDMANYLLFYLNRGNVHGTQVISADSLNRMEVPSSTWAAKEGLQEGYGLNNYCTIHDGFVYHGHDGTVPGGLTVMKYIPNEGIGYFYSLNANNYAAFEKIGEIIRAYITRAKQKPPIPPVVSLPDEVNAYSGWYEPNSPRMELFYFLERLMGLAYFHFEDNKLFVNSLGEMKSTFIPVTKTQFRYVPLNKSPDPVPSLTLLTSNPEGQFIQLRSGLITVKRIPTWLAILEMTMTGFVLLTLMSTLVYAPFLILKGLNKKYRRPAERHMRLWPLVAVLSLLSIVVISMQSSEAFLSRLANLSAWSFSLFLATIVFAVASIASVIALWRAPKDEVRRSIRVYSAMVTIALVISTAYFAYWGIIGVRTWA